jgi:electron transfer flavoprotein alpha subunit
VTPDDLGLAGLYETAPAAAPPSKALEDVKGGDWRNILVLGRATERGAYPETLALVGRARYLADELGCRVEVLLIGTNLDAATAELRQYPIDTIYRVEAPDYAPIDQTSRILEMVVRKRRPELVLVFQSRTGDAITAYAAARLAAPLVLGANRIEVDTARRLAIVTHESGVRRFQVVTTMEAAPQFVSVQRGQFRALPEEPNASVRVHDMKVDPGHLAEIEVLGHKPAPKPPVELAERVVVAGARVRNVQELEMARELANGLDAVFAVTIGIIERGFAKASDAIVVDVQHHRIAPRLLVTVGVRGALDLLEAVEGNPTICAVGCDAGDPIVKRAAYYVEGEVADAVQQVLKAL